MRCTKCRELISLAFDEDLSERDRSRLVEHLGDCADCRQHHAVLEQGRLLMQEGMVEVPENLEWKVQLGIQRALREGVTTVEEPRFGWSFWSRTAASAAAMAALVLVTGSFLLGQSRVGPAGPTPVGDSGSVEFASGAQPADPAAVPDLSGARPVTNFEVDAFGSGYGIRTVADQMSFGNVRRNYPMTGRRYLRRPVAPQFVGSHYPTTSQVLHLRIDPTKLRTSSAAAVAESAPASAGAADSAAVVIQPRR